MTAAWAGIDLGTQSVRVAIIDERGTVHAAARPIGSVRAGSRHEQDPTTWLTSVQQALRQVTAALDSDVHVESVAVSGTSGTVVPVDREGRPGGMAVMYDDPRGRRHLATVEQHGEALWRRLGYRMQASWGLPKMLALQDEGALTGGFRFAHQPDVITSWLAGRLLPSDLSSALKSGADLDSIRWPTALLDELGLAADAVNAIADSGARIGVVNASAAEVSGLPEGCTIVAGMTDGCAAQIASGALRSGDWNAVLGTTLVLKGAADRRRSDPSGAVYAHRAPFDGGWYPGGASSTGARAVAELLPGADLDDLTRRSAALSAVPAAYPLVGRGERFPFVAPEARGFGPDGRAFEQLREDERFRGIAFGVAFLERLSFDLLGRIGYDTTGRRFITGGGSRNPWWNQIRADVQQRALHVPAQSEGAVGMALLASAGVVEPEQEDRLRVTAEQLLGPPSVVEPTSARTDSIEEAYRSFVDRLRSEGWLAPGIGDDASMSIR